MAVFFHEEDIPAGVMGDGAVAVDTETMGLQTHRDRLCLLQISDGEGDEHLVRFGPDSDYAAPNLRAILADPKRVKLYHFARFDLAAIEHYMGVMGAGVLHENRIASYSNLYGSARPEGTGPGAARAGYFEAAAVQRLGQPRTQRSAAGLCRVRCSLSAPIEG